MEHLQTLAAILNSAMEHVPPHTRGLLAGPAQQAIAGVEKALANKVPAVPAAPVAPGGPAAAPAIPPKVKARK